MSITNTYYGRTPSGQDVYQYTLENDHGMRVNIIEYGCVITHIFVPDKDGVLQDVALGFDTLEDYEQAGGSLGAFVGRYANRIEKSTFTVSGKRYDLAPNDGPNHLHGTFGKTVFKGRVEGDSLVLTAKSPDGEDGFPGNLTVTVTYTLAEENALAMDYTATTDAPTIINLTNHSYFNLNGQASTSALDNTLKLCADTFTEGNAETCPTGRILPVAGTPFDFTQPKPIGQDIALPDEQLRMAGGYDHNFILRKQPGQLCKAAVATSAATGITMNTYTTQPGLQLYTGNYLDTVEQVGKHGRRFAKHEGFCLETQHFPCTPSHPEFPSVELRPGEEYHEITTYQFVTQ